jgi:propanol-preferring alcohol dehydrogenase
VGAPRGRALAGLHGRHLPLLRARDLDAAVIFAPVGPLVVEALKAVDKGRTVVCAGIHMSAIPAFPYRLLWEERVVRSVANLTREDGEIEGAAVPVP